MDAVLVNAASVKGAHTDELTGRYTYVDLHKIPRCFIISLMNPSELSAATFPKTNLTVLQDKSSFCFGIDAVLIADFARVKNGGKVFDLGTGTGIIPLLMAKTSKASHLTALEIQKESAEIASLNVEKNHLKEKISVVHGDIKSVRELFEPERADVVTSNPPYAKANAVRKNPNEAKNIARHEILCNLEDVVSAASYLLKSNGSFFMIHRPERLSEIFVTFKKYRLEAKTLQLVQPFSYSAPTMVLIEGRKNARAEIKILPTLVIYKAQGEYSESVKRIYEKY